MQCCQSYLAITVPKPCKLLNDGLSTRISGTREASLSRETSRLPLRQSPWPCRRRYGRRCAKARGNAASAESRSSPGSSSGGVEPIHTRGDRFDFSRGGAGGGGEEEEEEEKQREEEEGEPGAAERAALFLIGKTGRIRGHF